MSKKIVFSIVATIGASLGFAYVANRKNRATSSILAKRFGELSLTVPEKVLEAASPAKSQIKSAEESTAVNSYKELFALATPSKLSASAESRASFDFEQLASFTFLPRKSAEVGNFSARRYALSDGATAVVMDTHLNHRVVFHHKLGNAHVTARVCDRFINFYEAMGRFDHSLVAASVGLSDLMTSNNNAWVFVEKSLAMTLNRLRECQQPAIPHQEDQLEYLVDFERLLQQATEIDFYPEYGNGTGYFNPLLKNEVLAPITLPGKEYVLRRTRTSNSRDVLIIDHIRRGRMVVFKRYTDSPAMVAQMSFAWSTYYEYALAATGEQSEESTPIGRLVNTGRDGWHAIAETMKALADRG